MYGKDNLHLLYIWVFQGKEFKFVIDLTVLCLSYLNRMILGFLMSPCSFMVKLPTKWISFTFFSSTCNISLQHPAKICHHVFIPSSMTMLLHFFDILVKAFFLFLTVITKIFREVIDMGVKKVQFYAHQATLFLKYLHRVFHYFLIVVTFNVT